jgi:hypothetical protein
VSVPDFGDVARDPQRFVERRRLGHREARAVDVRQAHDRPGGQAKPRQRLQVVRRHRREPFHDGDPESRPPEHPAHPGGCREHWTPEDGRNVEEAVTLQPDTVPGRKVREVIEILRHSRTGAPGRAAAPRRIVAAQERVVEVGRRHLDDLAVDDEGDASLERLERHPDTLGPERGQCCLEAARLDQAANILELDARETEELQVRAGRVPVNPALEYAEEVRLAVRQAFGNHPLGVARLQACAEEAPQPDGEAHVRLAAGNK